MKRRKKTDGIFIISLFVIISLFLVSIRSYSSTLTDEDFQPILVWEEYDYEENIPLEDYSKETVIKALNDEYKEESLRYIDEFLAENPEYFIDDTKVIIEDGDYVDIDVKGYIDNSVSPGISISHYALHIGSGVLPDLEEALLGEHIGNEISIFVNNGIYSQIYGGTKIKFNAQINSILTPVFHNHKDMTSDFLQTSFSLNYTSSCI